MSKETLSRDLTVGKPFAQLVTFSIPFVISNLLQQAYSLADMAIVGQFIGSKGLAAANAGSEIAMFYLFLCMGFSAAGQIIIAQNVGVGNTRGVSRTIGTLFSIQAIIGLICCTTAFILCDGFLDLINVPEEAMADARIYSLVLYAGMIPVFGYNTISAILRGMGDSKHPMIFIAFSASLNVVLDLLFVGPLKMGCFGAALATSLSQTIAFIVSTIFLIRRKEAFGFDFKLRSFAVDKAIAKSILSLGTPLTLQNAAISLSIIYVNSYINAMGVAAAAATAVGSKVTLLATICTQAFYTAGSSIVAQNFAAGKHKRVTQTIVYTGIISIAYCGIISIILVLFPEFIFGIFDRNPEVLALSHVYAPIGAINFMGFASRAPAICFINGIGNSKLAFATGVADGIVARISLSLLFGITMGMGIRGFWMGSAIAGYMFAVVGLVYYFMGTWRHRKTLVAEQ
ncbi:MAG: MATE family efflux transporter [Oscillospiraceae bacterium]|nr:MATE family efflux transporter [Oscillospiraceae bacterium]